MLKAIALLVAVWTLLTRVAVLHTTQGAQQDGQPPLKLQSGL